MTDTDTTTPLPPGRYRVLDAGGRFCGLLVIVDHRVAWGGFGVAATIAIRWRWVGQTGEVVASSERELPGYRLERVAA